MRAALPSLDDKIKPQYRGFGFPGLLFFLRATSLALAYPVSDRSRTNRVKNKMCNLIRRNY